RADRAIYADFSVNGAKGAFAVTSKSAAKVSLVPLYGTAVLSAVPVTPSDMAAGDFNADGVQDLAILDASGNLAIELGKPDGTFTTLAARYTIGNIDERFRAPRRVVVSDLNHDGSLDVAVAAPDHVAILISSGGGSFRVPMAAIRPERTGPVVKAPERLI